jgi:Mg2+/Co2+ transporter CorC
MSDDRQRDDDPEISAANGARERWYAWLLTRFGLKSRESLRDDLEDALSETNVDSFSPQERAMLKNVLGFHRIRVDDVMVPRADIVAVAAEATLGEVLRLFRTAGIRVCRSTAKPWTTQRHGPHPRLPGPSRLEIRGRTAAPAQARPGR